MTCWGGRPPRPPSTRRPRTQKEIRALRWGRARQRHHRPLLRRLARGPIEGPDAAVRVASEPRRRFPHTFSASCRVVCGAAGKPTRAAWAKRPESLPAHSRYCVVARSAKRRWQSKASLWLRHPRRSLAGGNILLEALEREARHLAGKIEHSLGHRLARLRPLVERRSAVLEELRVAAEPSRRVRHAWKRFRLACRFCWHDSSPIPMAYL